MSCQLGHVILLEHFIPIFDKGCNTNILQNSSFNLKLETKSVAAEKLAAGHAFDYAFTMRTTMSYIFGNNILIALNTDSTSLSDVVAGMSATSEKGFLISLCIHCETYELLELTYIGLIPLQQNFVDALTETALVLALRNLLNVKRQELTANFWLEHRLETRQEWAKSSDAKVLGQESYPMVYLTSGLSGIQFIYSILIGLLIVSLPLTIFAEKDTAVEPLYYLRLQFARNRL